MHLRFCLGLLCVFTSISLKSQIGFAVQAGSFSFEELQRGASTLLPNKLLQFSAGGFYHMELKQVRIALNPGLHPQYSKGEFQNGLSFERLGIQLAVPISFYILDLGSDCNCPTFSKQGELFEKGFHLFLYPAANYLTQKLDQDQAKKNSGFEYQLGFGLGLDIGINRHSTLSPFLYYSRYFQQQLGFEAVPADWGSSEGGSSVHFGLKYTWYTKKRR